MPKSKGFPLMQVTDEYKQVDKELVNSIQLYSQNPNCVRLHELGVSMSSPKLGSSMQEDTTAPDEKDFGEHLRTIHFTLMALCIALLVVTTSPTGSSMAAAHQQIKDILELNTTFDSGWLQKAASQAINRGVFADSKQVEGFEWPRAIEVDGKNFNLKFNRPYWSIITPSFPASDDFEGYRGLDQSRSRVSGSPSLSWGFKDLPEFKNMWNGVQDGRIYVAIKEELSGQADLFGPAGHKFSSWKEIAPSPSYPTVELFLISLTKAEVNLIPKGPPNQEFAFVSNADVLPSMRLAMMVTSDVALVMDWQGELTKRFPNRWVHGKFESAFREVDVATRDFQDFSLVNLERIVRSEKERTREAFEQFGIKFPIESAARWGIFLVLATQIYFVIHFSEYKRRNLSGRITAWIGCYGSKGAKIIFIASSVLLPIAVVAYVCFTNKLIRDDRTQDLIATIVAALAVAFVAALTLLLITKGSLRRFDLGHIERRGRRGQHAETDR
jgi:hypothetical protein